MNSGVYWYESILDQFITDKGAGWTVGEMLGEGGSAGVWKVTTSSGHYALKLYKPEFLAGDNAMVEKHRVSLQSTLCSHSCHDLIQMYEVGYVGESAFILMEYLPWPSMDAVLGAIPAQRFSALLACVARAAKWLWDLGYVHRDIKPANILVSPEFDRAVLVDLGVVRFADSTEADLTDHGARTPFVATAQYSSPEYLFRTVEPGPDLWLGLTYYQLGAVLHDLLARTQLFDQEVKAFNKYVLAMAVMKLAPSFAMAERDPRLIALATRCLDKSLESRLRGVDWRDFIEGESFDTESAREKLRLKFAPVEHRYKYHRVAEEISQAEGRVAQQIDQMLRRICSDEGYPRAIWKLDKNLVYIAIDISKEERVMFFRSVIAARIQSESSGVEVSMQAGIFSSADGGIDGLRERKIIHLSRESIGAAADQLRDLLSHELLRSFYKANLISDGIETFSFPVDLS